MNRNNRAGRNRSTFMLVEMVTLTMLSTSSVLFCLFALSCMCREHRSGNGNEEGKTVIQSVDCCFSVLSLVHIQAFVSHVRASRIRTSFYIASAPIQFKLGEGPVQGPSLHSLLVFAESADQRSEYLPALRWIG
ncbi:UNVERIFIED_CONTAM: hypothetical protein Slati_4566100 [Sesamum latifolium]|uniref:Secreted protein n=1 Tax=Sesamum latifolium TaxID=2727402 RepID=A0AAW2SG58_9LAMI